MQWTRFEWPNITDQIAQILKESLIVCPDRRKQASTTFTYSGCKYIVQVLYSTSSASMELSLGASPPRMEFIIEELACTLTFCWATSRFWRRSW